MKDFRNRAFALLESFDHKANKITKDEAREKYCDIWEEMFEHSLKYGFDSGNVMITFLEVMKEIRRRIIST